MSSGYYIETEIHTTGKHHTGGYCSDPYDICYIDNHTKEIIDVPNKQFIEKYCNSDGEIDWDGMSILSSKTRLCNGSGYCGCEVTKTVTKASLKKRRNIKQQFIAAESSDDEDDYSVSPTKKVASSTKTKKVASSTNTKKVASSNKNQYNFNPAVNSFRGRYNSTYTANPNWYKKE